MQVEQTCLHQCRWHSPRWPSRWTPALTSARGESQLAPGAALILPWRQTWKTRAATDSYSWPLLLSHDDSWNHCNSFIIILFVLFGDVCHYSTFSLRCSWFSSTLNLAMCSTPCINNVTVWGVWLTATVTAWVRTISKCHLIGMKKGRNWCQTERKVKQWSGFFD